MPVITSKELGTIQDQLNLERNLVNKYTEYAESTNDTVLKQNTNRSQQSMKVIMNRFSAILRNKEVEKWYSLLFPTKTELRMP